MSRADEKIVQEAKDRYHRCEEYEGTARQNWLNDVKFGYGDDVNLWQWDEGVTVDRAGRPCLTVNKVRQHVLQIVNDARQNKATIKITPTGDGATYEAAQIYEGICRHVEYQSQATAAYDTATWNQVTGGIGYWRVVTRYVDNDSMDQELYIQRVADPLNVYLDPDIQNYDGSDAKFGFISSDILTEDAERDYPSIKGNASKATLSSGPDQTWHGSDRTRVVEYYRIKRDTDRLHVLPDGSTMRESEAEDEVHRIIPHVPMPAEPEEGAEPPTPKDMLRLISTRSRSIESPQVEWFKIVGDRVIDRKETVFDAIPIVRVVGEETVIEGRLDRKGHVRALRDAQRIYNYWVSAAVEGVALQPRSPFIAAAQAIEGHENDWENANTENKAVLTYNHKDDANQQIPKPERQPPPIMAQAFIGGMKIADEQMMMVSGQYQAELGRPGNETSGVAIQQRQRQGDTATYHYIDHLAQAIRFTGRLIVHAAPLVYDTARVLKIMAADGTQNDIHVDPDMPQAHQVQQAPPQQQGPQQPGMDGQAKDPQEQAAQSVRTLFNPSVGRYSVQADVGPSFGTQRQEAFNAFQQIVSQNKELVQVAGDLMFKNADFPGADEMAERLRRMLPPQATGAGPSPDAMKAQQQLQMLTQHGQQLAQQADQEVGSLKQQLQQMQSQLQAKDAQLALENYRAETARLAAVGGIDADAMKPLIRSMVSEMLGMPAVPVIQAHQMEDAMHSAALERVKQLHDAQAQQVMPPPPEQQEQSDAQP